MGADTNISWTDYTVNLWVGCTEVGPGCDNCYARKLAKRRGWAEWGAEAPRHFFKGTKESLIRYAKKQTERKKVFCMSLGDIFDNEVEQRHRDELWELVEQLTELDWQLLTKRIGNAKRMLPEKWLKHGLPSHVWLGITVADQREAERDIPKLLEIPARIHWLSIEPILGPITIEWPVEWVIVGGESGERRREMDLAWLESLITQCRAKNIPIWVKQDSAFKAGTQGRIPDQWWIHEFPT
jgi:protein gp37